MVGPSAFRQNGRCPRPCPTHSVSPTTPALGVDPRLTEVHSPMFTARTSLRPADVAIRAAIVALTLSTAYIHSTLGGLLFTLNSVGYAVAAVAMIVPLALAVRFRWVIRLGLMGYAATTIIGW